MSKYVATILIAVFAVSVASVDALKWCVTSTEEKTSCEKITNSAEMLAQIAVTCTVQTDCATSMQSGTVDIWSNVDGATLYDLNRAIGVSVVAGEAYSFTQAVNYYSTAGTIKWTSAFVSFPHRNSLVAASAELSSLTDRPSSYSF